MRSDGQDLAAWRTLARATRRRPLIQGAARVQVSAEGVRIGPGPSARLGALLLAFLGGMFLVAAALGAPLAAGGAILLAWYMALALGVALLLLGLLAAADRSCVWWRHGDPQLHVRGGRLGAHTAAVPKSEVQLVTEIVGDRDTMLPGASGQVALRWRWSVADADCALLAVGHPRAIEPIQSAWSGWLDPAQTQKRTEATVAGPSGEAVSVSQAALAETCATSESMRFIWRNPDQAVLRPTGATRSAGAVLGSLGAAALIWASRDYGHQGAAPDVLLTAVVGSAFVLCGLLLGLCGTSARRVIVDRVHRRVTFRECLSRRSRGAVSFDQVAALQVCSWLVKEQGDSASYVCYELNLVLCDPPGTRINLLSHAAADRLYEQGRSLAQFMGKPLLDHASAGSGTPPTTRRLT